MNKIFILKLCVAVNMIFLAIFVACFFIFNNGQSTYFRIGWSDNFLFVSMYINTPQRYFTLCFFIVTLNISEIFLNDVAYPLINFSTYNPYKLEIYDFTQSELEFYSNIIYFVQNAKRLLQIATAVSQIDLAFITLLSSQASIFFVIRYLLNKKRFLTGEQCCDENEESTNESMYKYVSVPYGSTQPTTELTRINI